MIIVGIGGGTCSGKTTLTGRLEKALGAKYKVAVINMDTYFRWMTLYTTAPFTGIEYVDHNHPNVVDLDKFYAAVEAAISDTSNNVVLVEGLFALYFGKLREKLDLKIFVDLGSDQRLYRRLKRHMAHGETMDEVGSRYLDTVRYRHDEFVEPTRWYADVIVNGSLDTHKGTDIIISHIEARIL